MIVTYAHKDDPDGQRFRQDTDYPLPKWATNVTCDYKDVRELELRVKILKAANAHHRMAVFVNIGRQVW